MEAETKQRLVGAEGGATPSPPPLDEEHSHRGLPAGVDGGCSEEGGTAVQSEKGVPWRDRGQARAFRPSAAPLGKHHPSGTTPPLPSPLAAGLLTPPPPQETAGTWVATMTLSAGILAMWGTRYSVRIDAGLTSCAGTHRTRRPRHRGKGGALLSRSGGGGGGGDEGEGREGLP